MIGQPLLRQLDLPPHVRVPGTRRRARRARCPRSTVEAFLDDLVRLRQPPIAMNACAATDAILVSLRSSARHLLPVLLEPRCIRRAPTKILDVGTSAYLFDAKRVEHAALAEAGGELQHPVPVLQSLLQLELEPRTAGCLCWTPCSDVSASSKRCCSASSSSRATSGRSLSDDFTSPARVR